MTTEKILRKRKEFAEFVRSLGFICFVYDSGEMQICYGKDAKYARQIDSMKHQELLKLFDTKLCKLLI